MPVKKKRKSVESWVCLGADVSMSSITVAGFGYSRTLGFSGLAFVQTRFPKDTHYYDRLKIAVRYPIWDLCAELNLVSLPPERIYIAVEEPFPMGMVGNRAGKFQSAWIKQQTQMQGAFIAGLLRQGYNNVFEINNTSWRKLVADDLGITTHHSKWDKWKPKEWAVKNFKGIPDLPDLIKHNKLGMIPRPEGSKAKAVQPEDIYDALAMAWWMKEEMKFPWEQPARIRPRKARRKGVVKTA